ncbi:hypothetical protein Pfo_007826 [Paulownia fortunei]|nr:hypothetical protein Pfo_007826 [Paulownia fortunei]
MKRPPAFFKVFIAEVNKNDLKIPPAFTRRLEQALPEKVHFRDRRNNVWTVKVAKVGDAWYFLDGWVKFADDNFLRSGDILVFEYYCDSLFNVKLYGTFATEKKIVAPFMLKDKEKQEQVSEDDNDDDDEETEDGNYVQMRHREIKHEESVQKQVNTAGAGSSRNTRERLINFSSKCYGMEIFQAGLAQQPRNPYFVTKIMEKRKGDLFIPMDVIKDNNLDLTQEIMLVDPRGRQFRAKCKKWKDGRMIVSGGWRSLCRLNFVQQEDKCICEFVQGGGRRLLLNVSWFRRGDSNMHTAPVSEESTTSFAS